LKISNPKDNLGTVDFSLKNAEWLATVDNVKTKILLLNEEIFIPELALKI